MNIRFFEVLRLETEAYLIYMPQRVSPKYLIDLRKSIKQMALRDGIEKIAIIYRYPDDSGGILTMPEYDKTQIVGIEDKIIKTAGISYEYVVFIGIPEKRVAGLENAVRRFYIGIHRLFPSLGRYIDFADTVEEAENIIKEWRDRYD